MKDKLNKVLAKIRPLEDAKATAKRWKEAGETVVFTNGCFDILHKGHVTYLAEAANLGTKLIVGLNTDASVKRLGKGEDRPVNPETARGLVLASLEFVDIVIYFDHDTPLDIIKAVLPSVLVKGGDYDANEKDPASKLYIVGSAEVIAAGGEVKTVDLVPGFSTTGIIEKLKH
jgi:rfaE bifunctional protein nucleotidyltransferase chain/domain